MNAKDREKFLYWISLVNPPVSCNMSVSVWSIKRKRFCEREEILSEIFKQESDGYEWGMEAY